jgi:hypothetical protein
MPRSGRFIRPGAVFFWRNLFLAFRVKILNAPPAAQGAVEGGQ